MTFADGQQLMLTTSLANAASDVRTAAVRGQAIVSLRCAESFVLALHTGIGFTGVAGLLTGFVPFTGLLGVAAQSIALYEVPG